MSLYNQYSKGYSGLKPVDIPDPSKKIRDQGLRVMEGMDDQIKWNAAQTDRLLAAFDQNNAIEQKQRADNFQLEQGYANTIASQKWRNYETAVNNAKVRQNQKEQDFQALLSLTESGAQIGKMVHDRNIKASGEFASQLYLNYGVGREGFNAIKSAEQSIISNNESLQALLRKYEIQGNIPMDVISKIRRSGGYLNFAIEKNSATRFGQTLLGRIGQRSNDEVQLPGMDTPITLNAAIEANPETARLVAQELIRQELHNEDGSQKYSNKVLTLAGVTGPKGHVANVLASFDQKSNEILVNNEWKDRYKETIEVLKSFMGPQDGTATPLGPEGIDAAIVYFAGGENATGEQYRISRKRVVGALVKALETQQISWDQVRGLETYLVKTKGTPGGKAWGDLYEAEWNQLKAAGKKFYEAENADLALENEKGQLEGKRFFNKVKEVIRKEKPGPTELAALLAHTIGKGKNYEDARNLIQATLTRGHSDRNDALGQAVLLARAKKGEYITDTMIEQWNLSKPMEALVRAEAAKHNDTVPQPGDNGTAERLEFAIEAKLNTRIKRTNQWYTNSTHNDAKLHAISLAAGYYKTMRDKGESHQVAYDYAVVQIENQIDSNKGYFKVESKRGIQYYAGTRDVEKYSKPITVNRKTISKELNNDPSLIYSKAYFDPSEIAAKASKGVYREPHQTAMLIQSLTKGRISAVDAMQAQLQYKRDQETIEFGAPKTPLLPDDYIKRYNNELDKVGPLTRRLLNSINDVDINKAYVLSGRQPVNQDPYYNKVNNIIEVGDPNMIRNSFDGRTYSSTRKLKYNITDIPISEVLQLMQNGHFDRAGNAQFSHESLLETAKEANIGLNAKFSRANQKKLQNVRFKKYGLAGFDHIEFTEDQLLDGENLHQNLNTEKVEEATYFRSPAACNSDACEWLMKNKPEIYRGLYK